MFVVEDRLVAALKVAEWVEGGNFPRTFVLADRLDAALEVAERVEAVYCLVNPVEAEEVPFGSVPSAAVD
jgi:hypothetical protein